MNIKLNKEKEYVTTLVLFESLLLGFFADIKCVNMALTYGTNYFNDGTMSILYPAVFLLMLFVIIVKRRAFENFNIWTVVLLFFLIFFYVYTYNFIGLPKVRLPLFLSFTLMAFLMPHFVNVRTQIALKAVMFYPFFSLFKLREIFYFSLSWLESISMDISYGYLIPIAATIVYLKCYFAQETLTQKIITIILCLANIAFMAQLLLYGSRGPLVCLILLVLFLWSTDVSPKGFVIKKGKFSVALIAAVVVALSFMFTMRQFSILLSDNNVSFRFVDKILELSAENNLSNGREDLNVITWNGIMEEPIFGHGLDRYEANTGFLYPHNFLLQILYDGGIFFFLVLVPIVFRNTIIRFRNANKDEYAMYSFLLFASVPGALFSQDMWNLSILWLFFGSVITKNFIYKKNNYEKSISFSNHSNI